MKELTLEAKIENITRVTEFVNIQLEEAGCNGKAQRMMDVAIDELFSNIAYYAYGEQQGMATVRVEVQPDLRTETISFIDAGIPFNPLTQKEPLTGLGVKERKAGGFGISIVKKSMDFVHYEYQNGCNVTTIMKTFQ